MVKAIQIDDRDNVATLTGDVGVGDVVEVLSPATRSPLGPLRGGRRSSSTARSSGSHR
jgi:hypothetical protein